MSIRTAYVWTKFTLKFMVVSSPIAGNLLTVVALLRCPKLRAHATTLFVISLAASDLLFCAVNLPLTAARYIHREWTLGPVTCR